MKKLFTQIKYAILRNYYAAKMLFRTGFTPQLQQQQQAGTWPPVSGTTTGFVAKGITTIMWGVEGLLQSPKPAGGYYTVLRCHEKPIVDRSKLPNGLGLTTSDVYIQDGVMWEITVRDDSRITPPNIGLNCSIVDASGILGNVGLVYTARVTDNGWESASKQPGERTLTLENLVLIDSQASAAQP